MRRGLRSIPVPRTGRRLLGLVGLGLLAAMSLVWQQQATLASFIDAEFAGVTFKAAKLPVIAPETSVGIDSVEVTWNKAVRSDGKDYNAEPSYTLNWSPDGTGTGTNLYNGAYVNPVSHANATDKPTDRSLTFTDISTGNLHACGIARGSVYCWGTSTVGALGGASSPTKTPTEVSGLPGVATAVAAGTDFSCAVVDVAAYCWGEGTDGQLGNGTLDSPTPKLVGGLTGKAVTSISAGGRHACVVADKVAYCWGSDAYGQLGDNAALSNKSTATAVAPAGILAGRTVASVSAGGNHTCAVADGRAFCWGQNDSYQVGDGSNPTTNQPIPLAVSATGELMGRTVSAVAAGGSHTCAIADSNVFCWGLNSSWQLGNGTTTQAKIPTATTVSWAAGAKPIQIASGSLHSCALVDDGKAYCWGSTYNAIPTPVTGLAAGKTIASVSLGTNFGCAVVLESLAACVGENGAYQLGNGTQDSLSTFTNVVLTGLSCPDKSVRTSLTTCSLKQGTTYFYQLDYSVGQWGATASDPVPATTLTRDALKPRKDTATSNSITVGWDGAQKPGVAYQEYQLQRSLLPDGSNPEILTVTGAKSWTDNGGFASSRAFEAVSAGGGHSCGIVGGALYCWGFNDQGQLGIIDRISRSTPTLVSGLSRVTAVSAGARHTCAISEDSTYCWGLNDKGQLGLGATKTDPYYATPQKLAASYSAISAGTSHTCGISSKSVFCWGANASGQLGDDTTNGTANYTPVKVSDASAHPPLRVDFTNANVTSVAAGGTHSCVVVDDGGAWCWGSDSAGQLGNGGSGTSSSPQPVQTEKHTPLTRASAITVGTAHSCVRTTDGAVYCWGDDASGQLGNSSTFNNQTYAQAVSNLSGATEVSAGASSTCAIAGTKAYCWGLNASGQLGNNNQPTNSGVPVAVLANGALSAATVSGITTGSKHACALASNAAYCWGGGTDGRLGNGATADFAYPQAVDADARCANGSVSIGDGTCSFASGATVYYQLTFTLDGTTRTSGGWTRIST